MNNTNQLPTAFKPSLSRRIDQCLMPPAGPIGCGPTVTVIDLELLWQQAEHPGYKKRRIEELARPQPNVLGIWVGATIFGMWLGLFAGWGIWS